MNKYIFIITIFVAGMIYSSKSTELITIKNCYDGDTCTTNKGEKIRLACIDAPEMIGSKSEPIAALAAKEYLNKLIGGKEVTIRRIRKDRYGRTVAELSKRKMNVQKELFKRGFAKIYQHYANQCEWSKRKDDF